MKRLDLKVGYACNNNCRFCAQAHNKHLPQPSTRELEKKIERGYEDGCTGIVFTGGEPTIRRDLVHLVAHARSVGYELIQIQTNGRLLYYEKLVQDLVRAGVTEFSPALHGATPEVHEYLTRARGSWKQTVTGIINIKKHGLPVITNTVITKTNYTTLPEIVSLLLNLGVDQFQLAFVHPVGNAYKNFYSIVPRKTMVMPYVHRALDIHRERGEPRGVIAMVEAFPYCFMRGYEKYCSENYIPETDIFELEREIRNYSIVRRTEGKAKSPKCAMCVHNSYCEGPWKEYPEKYGFGEFVPVVSREG